MNLTTHARDLFHLERHRDYTQKRIDLAKKALQTAYGNTPANRALLYKLRSELRGINNEIKSFGEYLKSLS